MNPNQEKQVIKYLLFYASILLLIDLIFSFIGSVVNVDYSGFPFIDLNLLHAWKFGLDLPARFIFNFGLVSLVYFILKANDIDLNEYIMNVTSNLKQKWEARQSEKSITVEQPNPKTVKVKNKSKQKKPTILGLVALLILLVVLISTKVHYGTLFILSEFTDERFVLLVSYKDLQWVSNVIIISVIAATFFYLLKFITRTRLIEVMKSVVDLVIVIIIAMHPYELNDTIINEYPVFEHASEVLQAIFFVVIIIVFIELIVNCIKFLIELVKQGELH